MRQSTELLLAQWGVVQRREVSQSSSASRSVNFAVNRKMNISIVDSGANEIFFEKMDGAYLGGRDIAFHKAQTAAHLPSPTRFFQELAFGNSKRGPWCPG